MSEVGRKIIEGMEDALAGRVITHPLPCPFCGEAKHISAESDTAQGGKWGQMVCQACAAKGPEVRTGYAAIEKWREAAVAEWNKRAEDSKKPTPEG